MQNDISVPYNFKAEKCERCKHGIMQYIRIVQGYAKYKCSHCDAVEIREVTHERQLK